MNILCRKKWPEGTDVFAFWDGKSGERRHEGGKTRTHTEKCKITKAKCRNTAASGFVLQLNLDLQHLVKVTNNRQRARFSRSREMFFVSSMRSFGHHSGFWKNYHDNGSIQVFFMLWMILIYTSYIVSLIHLLLLIFLKHYFFSLIVKNI